MLFSRNIITGLILAISIFICTGSAFARNSLRLILEDKANARVPISSVCPSIPESFTIERIKGELNFADKKHPDKQTVENGLIPKLSLIELYAQGVYRVISLINKNNSCRFSVNFAISKIKNEDLKRQEGRGRKIFSSGNHWFVLEETSRSTRGNLTILYEDTQSVSHLRSGCFREYDPRGSSLFSMGIVTWNKDNPAREGYSVKGDKIDSPWVRDLKCPTGPNRSQYKIDGIYNMLWSLTHGNVLKVPDHCTAKLEINPSTNRRYFSCCCNATGNLATNERCRWLDPRSEWNWPDMASDRCGAKNR
jgi:hypothetical protein